MIIRYSTGSGEKSVLNVSSNMYWELQTRLFDDCGLYLILVDKDIEIRDAFFWCAGTNIPCDCISDLYEDILNTVAEKLLKNPLLYYIDIDEIENKLIKEKYEELWSKAGYITLEPGKVGTSEHM